MKLQVTDRLIEVVGLFENTLGRYSDYVAFNQDKELIKNLLCDVYGYKDIHKFFKPELDEEAIDRFFKTVFTYYENKDTGTEK